MGKETVVEVQAEGEGSTRQVSIVLNQRAWSECCGDSSESHLDAWGDMLTQMIRAIAYGMQSEGLMYSAPAEVEILERINETISNTSTPCLALLENIDFNN